MVLNGYLNMQYELQYRKKEDRYQYKYNTNGHPYISGIAITNPTAKPRVCESSYTCSKKNSVEKVHMLIVAQKASLLANAASES
jgi:hypothetical protein